MKLFQVLTNLLRKFGINANKINLTANDILNLIAGNEINLKSRNLTIKSDNFSVDKNGNLSCSNANMSGGQIDLMPKDNMSCFRYFSSQNKDTNNMAYITGNVIGINKGDARIDISLVGTYSDGSKYGNIQITDGKGWSEMSGSEVTSPKITQRSLESIKKNISKLEQNALDIINNSDIYEYNLKSEEDTDKKHIGFVIGENYRTPQEVISKEGNSIELYSAIGILWKAMQEQQKQNEKLTKRIEELESLYPN